MIINLTDKARQYRSLRQKHWDDIALQYKTGTGKYYHKRINEIYKFLIPSGQDILEIGCGRGDLLAFLEPGYGVGVDFSEENIRQASTKHPGLNFLVSDAHEIKLDKKFDVIILSDLVNDLWDVQLVFQGLEKLCSASTRIIINFYSHLWELPLAAAQYFGMATPLKQQNWLTVADITNLANMTGFEVVHSWREILWPLATPLVANMINKFPAKVWPFDIFDLTNFMVLRCHANLNMPDGSPSVSVVVPACNEAGNIDSIITRTPEMGSLTEIVFVEGGSTDDTYRVIKQAIEKYPRKNLRLLKQTGKGKGDAVRLGFAEAKGDILMILDADMTVPPEKLPLFFEALVSGKGEFINGVRLVYPMEEEAMRYLNLIGNKFFSLAFSWLLGQPIKDTLCGTKVLWKKDYLKIAQNRSYFGDFDPFGDFDLLFGSAKINLKIVEIPIRYAERTYGSTNIDRWRHGLLLLKMVFFASRKIKFI